MAVDTISLTHAKVRRPARLLNLPVQPALVCIDAAAAALALLVFPDLGRPGLVFLVAVLAAMAVAGLYRVRISPSVSQECSRLIAAVAVPAAAIVAVGGAAQADIARAAVLAAPALIAGRAIAYAGLRSSRAKGLILEPVVIVGAGSQGAKLASALLEHPEYGLVPIGFVDGFDDADLPVPILGKVSALRRVIHEHEVRRVIVAFGATREPDLVQVIRACDEASADIYVLPRFFELGVAPRGADADEVWGIPLMRLNRAALRTPAWRAKRAFDVAVAGTALFLTLPLFAVLSGLVKLSSPGPVFFKQRRVGQRGDLVDILKFRSMRQNTDSDVQWSVRDDDRVTWVGRFLRRTSLDELPQLINILRGDMSLVGPRPERPFFAAQFGEDVTHYDDRHRVPVGLTGWAQVHGLRGDTSIEERARFDNHYIENWSLWKDVAILFRTAREVARGGGE